jgi:hypothetical protein
MSKTNYCKRHFKIQEEPKEIVIKSSDFNYAGKFVKAVLNAPDKNIRNVDVLDCGKPSKLSFSSKNLDDFKDKFIKLIYKLEDEFHLWDESFEGDIDADYEIVLY